jgi:hypothetical protein
MPKKDRSLDEGEEVETTEEAMPETAAVEPVASTEGLVKVQKGDEVLHIHPTTVKAHKEAGWKIV